jgi:hypothetical protein
MARDFYVSLWNGTEVVGTTDIPMDEIPFAAKILWKILENGCPEFLFQKNGQFRG